ncbi:hypothetical protein GB937_001735 [Aspergillus fischeri]|nr:hypothetical protein GB937_001735 [Aspergillus fischeri]
MDDSINNLASSHQKENKIADKVTSQLNDWLGIVLNITKRDLLASQEARTDISATTDAAVG